MPEPTLRARLVDGAADLRRAMAIREEVFVVEQAVPPELEVDGLDPLCTHLVAERAEAGGWRVIGAARLRPKGALAKAERVAVLAAERGLGAGALLMAALEEEARQQGFAEVVLNAQVQVVPFYERLGYRAEGPEFEEAGIQHRAMRKRISRQGAR